MRTFPVLRWLVELPTQFDDALDWAADPFLDLEPPSSLPFDWSGDLPAVTRSTAKAG